MSGKLKKEYGDYQTPLDFCQKVCEYIKFHECQISTKVILEPTCGIGNFLCAASTVFGDNTSFGIEINEEYANIAATRNPASKIIIGNIFDINTQEICDTEDILIIGNPPWATNSNQEFNLHKKVNFKKLRGIDALTGSSNFDICEYIILKLLDNHRDTNSTICMLCKTTVARNILLEISRNNINYQKVEILNFNGSKVFGISASACVLFIKLTPDKSPFEEVICDVKNFDDGALIDRLCVHNGIIKTANSKNDFEGKSQFTWRQGVKHDCSKVMELDLKNNELVNKQKAVVNIEDTLVYPLVKSSHFKSPIINEFSKYVIVTQHKPKEDTEYIRAEHPLTWAYLNENIEYFNNRKSVIYKKSAPFAMFGVGDYSFAPYKVGLSGFYKEPLFCLLHSDKPVMTDDTSYFLAFNNYDIAYCMMLLLNSKDVQDFLKSIAFLDNKRPYTVKLLSRLDFKKCVDNTSFEIMKKTEYYLNLVDYLTDGMYQEFKQYIYSIK